MNEESLSMADFGAQLKCPSGKFAKEVADRMFQANENMIQQTLLKLPFTKIETLLEIGFGNGQHLIHLFNQHPSIAYTGLDHSQAMLEQAQRLLFETENSNAQLILGAADKNLPFPNNHFDSCFTVNTLYFMKNPSGVFKEIYRVLKEEAVFSMGFVEKTFGEKLPFTHELFTFYPIEQLKEWLKRTGFKSIHADLQTESLPHPEINNYVRPFYVLSATK